MQVFKKLPDSPLNCLVAFYFAQPATTLRIGNELFFALQPDQKFGGQQSRN